LPESGEIELRVAEALQQDVGKGMVRIDHELMSKIGASPGDIVEIIGKRTTGAIAGNSYPADVGLEIVRMDGLTRSNAGTSIGEAITIRKAQPRMASKVVIAPAAKGMRIMASGDIIKRNLMGRAVTRGDVLALVSPRRTKETLREFPGSEDIFREFFEATTPFSLGEIKFTVVSSSPAGLVRINDTTQVEVRPEAVEVMEKKVPDVTYDDVGGLKKEISKVREMIELPLRHPEIFDRLGIDPPKGVLLHGAPGTGKTLLAKAVASESGSNFVAINGPEVMSKFVGEAEKKIREIFEEAAENAPTVIFIDEIDAISPKREEVSGEVERRTVAQLLTLMDGLKTRGQVVVIGATNRVDALDPAIRRPGRFDREIEIGVPDKDGRNEVLQIHTRGMPLDEKVDLDEIADVTHGFVGADLESLCKEAAMRVLRRILPDIKAEEEIPKETLQKMIVKKSDFKEALKEIQPSALREVLVQVPNVTWNDIGGLESTKQELQEAVEWPLKYPDNFEKFGVRPPKGVLLYGSPGTGKTLLAKAVANESDANFIAVKGPELLSKWVGESEKGVREVFRKARQTAPTVIFFDEIDSIASTRSGGSTDSGVTQRVVNQLLTEIDGMEELQDVAVIAATNRVDIIDPALLRPGRFDRHIKVDIPDEKARLAIFKVHTKKMPLADDVDIEKLAKDSDGYVGADIEAVCREAVMLTLRDNIEAADVKMKYFKEAMKKVKPKSEVELVHYH